MHLKIVVDVITDTASSRRRQADEHGACYWSDLSGEDGFHWLLQLCAPSGCHMACKHDGTGRRQHTYACTCSIKNTKCIMADLSVQSAAE